MDVENRIGVEGEPQLLGHQASERDLVRAADGGESLAKRRVVGQRRELGEPTGVVEDGRPDGVDNEAREARIRLIQPAAERDAVGLVHDAAGIERTEILEHRRAHEFRVQAGDTVHAMRAEKGEVAHAHVATAILLDQRHRRQPAGVVAAARTELIEVLGVEEVDDLHVPRQQAFHERHRPPFERLGQQRVVRVAEHRLRNVPREVPRHRVLVDEQPHQLRNRDRRMRVVELDRDVIGQRRQVAVLLKVPPQEVLERRRREKDLLPESQLVSGGGVVARVQHPRDRLEPHAVGEGADMISTIEVLEIELIGGARRPQPQRVDVHAAPPGDGRVVRHRLDAVGRVPHRARRAVRIRHDLHRSAEADGVGDLGPRELPRIARRQPVLGKFHLLAVLQHLAKDAVVVSDAVAVRRNPERRHALHEAGGEAAEAAIAQRRVGLELAQPVEVDAEVREGGASRVGEPEVAEGVEQHPTGEKLEGKVADAFAALAIRAPGGIHPVPDDVITGGERGRDEPVVLEGVLAVLADGIDELPDDRRSERGNVGGGGGWGGGRKSSVHVPGFSSSL